jgi:hypothetical protein
MLLAFPRATIDCPCTMAAPTQHSDRILIAPDLVTELRLPHLLPDAGTSPLGRTHSLLGAPSAPRSLQANREALEGMGEIR